MTAWEWMQAAGAIYLVLGLGFSFWATFIIDETSLAWIRSLPGQWSDGISAYEAKEAITRAFIFSLMAALWWWVLLYRWRSSR